MRVQTGPRSFGEVPDHWLMRIGLAATSPDLIQVAREFVAEMTEAERMRLPSSLLPPPLKSPEDVNNYALSLTRAQLGFKGPLASGVVLDRLTVFFAAVSGRIAQLEDTRARA